LCILFGYDTERVHTDIRAEEEKGERARGEKDRQTDIQDERERER